MSGAQELTSWILFTLWVGGTAWFLGRRKNEATLRQLAQVEALLAGAREDHLRLEADRKRLEARILELERQDARSTAERQALQESLERRQVELQDLHSRLTLQFEKLAKQTLDQTTRSFREDSERSLESLLSPLKDRILEFQQKVDHTYSEEAIGRRSLKEHIDRVIESQNRLTAEAGQLSKALRGDVKTQGNWGELVLTRILEASGLRPGEDYIEQGKDLGLKSEEGASRKPDVIVRLPEGKSLIVDSKVSLVAYERLGASETDEERRSLTRAFLQSVHSHVEDLASKRYADAPELQTPEFVLLFLPIEGAFALALQADPSLYERAWKQRIILVSPTTLLATLKTVATVWKQERQRRNVLEIARAGGALYDKFVLLTESLSEVQTHLQRTQRALDESVSRIRTGNGNLLSRVERLRSLGASTTRTLAPSWQAEETWPSEQTTAYPANEEEPPR
jgi:DNA recombination protein RmuC